MSPFLEDFDPFDDNFNALFEVLSEFVLPIKFLDLVAALNPNLIVFHQSFAEFFLNLLIHVNSAISQEVLIWFGFDLTQNAFGD